MGKLRIIKQVWYDPKLNFIFFFGWNGKRYFVRAPRGKLNRIRGRKKFTHEKSLLDPEHFGHFYIGDL